jgi:hypothetical protein
VVAQGGQAAQVQRDVVGLADVQWERGSGERFAEQVAAQE